MANPNPKRENLKPFKPGVDNRRNYKGRPKMPDIREALDKILGEEEGGMSALEAILIALRKKAFAGDTRAIQELLDRAYGKAKQYIDHTTKDESINKFDPSKLSDEDLRTIAELQRKGGIE